MLLNFLSGTYWFCYHSSFYRKLYRLFRARSLQRRIKHFASLQKLSCECETSLVFNWWEKTCFCGIFSLLSVQDHYRRCSQLQASDLLRAEFESAHNLSSGFVVWCCAVVIMTTAHPPQICCFLWLITNK